MLALARHLTPLLILPAMLAGCTAESTPYDADWEADGFLAGGKADGLLDIVPAIAFGEAQTGTVGGEEFDLYKIDLLRTDRVEMTMTVTDGDLDPHLSFYRGTSIYIESESWEREGSALIKTYEVGDAGTYLIAVRAYREEGRGDYSLSLRCAGGPCAGELPPPESEYSVNDVAHCITQAHTCAFDRLPRYDGRVGEVRAQLLFQECLDEALLEDGSSCASACAYRNPDDEDDAAEALCNSLVSALPWYADQSTDCHGALLGCMSDCADAQGYGYSYGYDELWSSTIAICWENGFNGNCDSYARGSQACGGDRLPDSAWECEEHCQTTSGAWIDDIQDICGDDAYCDEYCDVDIEAAAEACGGYVSENESCIVGLLDERYGWECIDRVEDEL